MTTELAASTNEPQTNNKQQQNQQQQQQQQQHIKKDLLISSSQSWHPSSKSDNNNNDTTTQQQTSQQTTSTTTTTSTTSSNTQSILTDPNIKFPLENSWSFWFYKNEKTKTWKENVKFITTVDFVEDFWGVYNHLQLVSRLSPGCDYMFFKKDIPPMWEDPQNLDGGRWVLNLDKRYRTTSLDVYWLNTLLALIGDQFMDESTHVNGVWVNVRPKADKIALWTKSAKDADLQMKIGRKFKDILGLKDNMITYEEHDESSKKTDQAPMFKL